MLNRKTFIVLPLVVMTLLLFITVTYVAKQKQDTRSRASTGDSASWWNAGWKYRVKIALNNTASTEDLINFPLHIALSGGNFNYGNALSAGQDIRFVDADGVSILPHEIEKWNTSGTSDIWVKVPQINAQSSSDYIWLYYGNPGAGDGQNRIGVWNSNFMGVWHLPNGTTLSGADSTGYGRNGSNISSGATTGVMDGGASLNGSSSYIGTSLDVQPSAMSSTTWEAWIYPTSTSGTQMVFSNDDGYFDRGVESTRDYDGRFNVFTGSGVWTPASPTLNSWQHIAVVYTPGNIYFYKNGTKYSYGAPSTGSSIYKFNIGRNPGFGEYFAGKMDEVRVSNVARSANWIQAEYKSMANQMAALNNEESQIPTATPVPPTNTPVPTLTPTNTPIPVPPTHTPVPPTPTNTPSPTLVPTATSIPSPTPIPGDSTTSFNIQLKLHGLGSGGDSVNVTGIGNMTPLHPQKLTTVDVYDVQNNLVASRQGYVVFDPNTGTYKGSIDMGTTIASGVYTVKIKTDKFLRVLVPGIQSIQAFRTNVITMVTMIGGDVNADNSVNILDYNILMGCYADLSAATNCAAGDNTRADLTDDGAVNQFDYNFFLRELTTKGGE
jgi:hypothetical protein